MSKKWDFSCFMFFQKNLQVYPYSTILITIFTCNKWDFQAYMMHFVTWGWGAKKYRYFIWGGGGWKKMEIFKFSPISPLINNERSLSSSRFGDNIAELPTPAIMCRWMQSLLWIKEFSNFKSKPSTSETQSLWCHADENNLEVVFFCSGGTTLQAKTQTSP